MLATLKTEMESDLVDAVNTIKQNKTKTANTAKDAKTTDTASKDKTKKRLLEKE